MHSFLESRQQNSGHYLSNPEKVDGSDEAIDKLNLQKGKSE